MLISAIPFGFGVNYWLRPDNAVTWFNNSSMPMVNNELIHALVMVLGARNILWGIATFVTAYYGNKKAQGWVMVVGGANAFVDGLACKMHLGGGEWDHWGYAPMLLFLGISSLVL